MIKKTLIIIILFISTVECSSIRNKKISESLYDKILNEIVINNVFKLDNIEKTRISKEIIPFNTISTDLGFINKNITPNYNPYHKYNEIQNKKIELLIDSLQKKDDEFNKNFKKGGFIDLNSSNIKISKETKYILFFSNIVENRLYVELRKFNYLDIPITSPSSEIFSYGLCHSYLYEVKKNKLKILSYGYYDLN